MSDYSTRRGDLAGQWDGPDPDELTARLQPEPDVADRLYGNRCVPATCLV
jgi:hypothetical protein